MFYNMFCITIEDLMLALLFMITTPSSNTIRIQEIVDPLTDKSDYFIAIASKKNYLAIGCNEQKSRNVSVIVKFDHYLGEQTAGILAGGMPTVYRFDKMPPIEERWNAEQDRGFAEFPSSFIRAMMGTSYIYIKAQDNSGYPVTADFSYSLSPEIYKTMFEKCGLNPDGSVPKKQKKKKS